MTRAIPDIFEDWVNSVSTKGTIKNVVDNLDGTSAIETCNTLWALECLFLTVNGIEYKIISIERDKSITVQGLIPSIEKEFELKNPFFIHGTPTQSNIERDLLRKNGKKHDELTPLVYLFEPIREDFNNELDSIEREVSIRFAVLNNFKKNQFTNDIYNYSVYAMRSYAEQLIEVIKKDVVQVDRETLNYNIISYTKYGQFIDRSGSKKNIFNEELAGVEINLKISLKSSQKCLSLCNN